MCVCVRVCMYMYYVTDFYFTIHIAYLYIYISHNLYLLNINAYTKKSEKFDNYNLLRHIYAKIQIYLKRLSYIYILMYNLMYRDLKSKYEACHLAKIN